MKIKVSHVASTLLVGFSLAMIGCSSDSSGGGTAPVGTNTTSYGTASVSGTTATEETTGVAPTGVFSAQAEITQDTSANATLIVDENNDGVYGDSKDVIYTSQVMSDGSFGFEMVRVPETGSVKAQLTVKKDGYAPYTKVISLSNQQNLSLVADAASTPVGVEVITLPEAGSATRKMSYLKIATGMGSMGVQTYAKVMSLSELQASADVPTFGNGTQSESVIPTASFPDDVTSVTATMRAFDPTDAEDIKKFPGEFKGAGRDAGAAQNTNEIEGLVSVSFDLLELEDQNGNLIELDESVISPSKLSSAATYDNCLVSKKMYVNSAQVALITSYGDYDDTVDGIQVPLWYYNSSTGIWDYLGNGTYDENVSSNYVDVCITENWGEYVNLDYPFSITEPKTICVDAKYEGTEKPVTDLSLVIKKDTNYEYMYTNYEGKTALAMTAGSATPSDYTITYSGSFNGWNSVTVDSNDIITSSTEGCDYDLTLLLEDPYSATLEVIAKDLDGNTVEGGYAYVSSSSYADYFYRYVALDAQGKGTVNVKPNVNYTVSYKAGKESANVNNSIVAPETADSGRYATVAVQDTNRAPDVYVYLDRSTINNQANTVGFYVGAYDANGDDITLSSLKLNNTTLQAGVDYTVNYEGSYGSSHYFSATLDLSSSTVSAITPASLAIGSYTLEATYTDSKQSANATASLNVAANRAPIISYAYLYSSETNRYVDLSRSIPVGTYDLYTYMYDLDGDSLDRTYTLDDTVLESTSGIALSDGEHTLTVSATEATTTTPLSASKTFTFTVGNNAPTLSSVGASRYIVDINDATKNTLKLYAYANDKDGDSVTVSATDQNGTSYSFTQSFGKYSTSEITPTGAGDYTFTITASDGNKTSVIKEVKVSVIAGNQAPIFSKELTSETINVNTSKEFVCEASDPEGSYIFYAWSIDGVTQSETSTTLNHTFTQTGGYVVACTATDADGESATSNATMIVSNPNISNTLSINTKLPGMIVAVHDSSTLAVKEQKESGSTGVASFSLTGDRTTFSVSMGPDFVLPQERIVADILSEFANDAQSACYGNTIGGTIPSECATFDYCDVVGASSIATSVIDLAKQYTSTDIPAEVTSSILDTNSDGLVSSSELYAAVLSFEDENGDGKIQLKEFDGGDISIRSEFFVNVPVGSYTISLEAMYYDEEYVYMYNGFSSCNTVQYSVSGLDDSTYSLEASGGLYNYYYNDLSIINGVATVDAYLGMPQTDDLYSALFRYQDATTENAKFYFLKDQTEAQIKAVSLNAADFTVADITTVTVQNAGYDTDQYFYIYPSYKGVSYRNLNFGTTNDVQTSTIKIANRSDMRYNIEGHESIPQVDGYMYRWHWNYYGDGTLKTSYNANDYAYLDVTAAALSSGEGVSLSGKDLGLLNDVGLTLYSNGETTDGAYYNSMVSFMWTVAPTTITKPDLAQILPEGIKEYYDADMVDEGAYIYAEELKEMSESEFISIVASGENYYWRELEANGVRSIDRGLYSTQLVSAMSTTGAEDVKPRKKSRPFSIGYDPIKLLAK